MAIESYILSLQPIHHYNSLTIDQSLISVETYLGSEISCEREKKIFQRGLEQPQRWQQGQSLRGTRTPPSMLVASMKRFSLANKKEIR